MALRQIHHKNALPTSDHHLRLKKTTTTTAVPVPTTMPLNDENAPPPTTTVDAVVIDYVDAKDLLALADPDVQILGLVEGLESADWIKMCESLNDVRRFSIHHSAMLIPILEKVMVLVVKAMKNPRSALCKTSIMAAADIFSCYGDSLLIEETMSCETFDQLFMQLLLKASQDKKFVCEEADRALKVMVDSMTSLPLLNKLQKYIVHTNPRIRAKAAVSVSNCISKMELDAIKEFGLVSLIQTALKLLNDRLPEARESARCALISIYEKFTENEDHKLESWRTFCDANLSAIQALAAIKIAPS